MSKQLTADCSEVFAEDAESSAESSAIHIARLRIRYLILIALTSTLVSTALPRMSLGAQSESILGARAPRPQKRAQHAQFFKVQGSKAFSRFALIAGEAPALPVFTGSVQFSSTFGTKPVATNWSLAFVQTKPDKDYLVYVVSESADKIALIRFGPNGARIDHELETGDMPIDIDGPHGIVMSPDRKSYYVSIAHGRPFGTIWKYSTRDDRVEGKTTLGYFPATVDVTPDGSFLFVVNFNLHGDMVPSSVSVVSTATMTEIARIQTCTMPHGSRLNPQGTKQYSACMMDDMLVEIDTRTLKVARHFIVTRGHEMGVNGAPKSKAGDSMASMPGMKDMGGHGMEPPKPGDNSCSPTWAQPSAEGASVYVACNKSSEIVEINANTWQQVRRIPARAGVYNLGITHDGTRLLATNKRDQSVSIYDLKSGKELARLPTKRKVLHGVVVSPDDLYAFVTVEGVGSEPGTVEIIDLKALKTVATVDVGAEAAGVDFYKTEPPK